MAKRFFAFILVLTLAFSMTACSAKSGTAYDESISDNYYNSFDSVDGSFGTSGDLYYPEADMEYESPSEPSYSDKGSATNTSSGKNDLAERKIIKTANLRFETKEYDTFMADMSEKIFQYGGYIESSEAHDSGIYGTKYSRNSRHVIRIPQESYNSFMNEVCTLGNMTYKSENSNDVTMNYVDTESRIKAYQAEYDALIQILEKAESLNDVIQLQSRISDVTYMLESYKSQLRKYDALVSYCTINLSVEEVWRETKNEEVLTLGQKIALGLEDTFLDIKEDVSEAIVWFVTALPYIIIWVIIIIVVVAVIGTKIKKAKKKRNAKKANEKLENKEDN
ncbi:MAG: DUF4349 domain-containing protein [Ruminococcaceae bacterium]|nr:DUF4349 domain-containing protein [Oscillospiraceae bacterium]